MDENPQDVVIPVVSEELHADAEPVVTGGVRVTKRVHTHDEVLEQELRQSHAEVKRVRTNRVVDGPQPVQRNGNTLIIPVVSEVLRIEKQWVVTEEIHITQTEQLESIRQTVPVAHEEARVERLDASGNTISTLDIPAEAAPETSRLNRPAATTSPASTTAPAATSRRPRSLLTKKSSA